MAEVLLVDGGDVRVCLENVLENSSRQAVDAIKQRGLVILGSLVGTQLGAAN